MRAALRLLASTETKPNLLGPARPLALLPPIPLYRRILRAHRKLTHEQRVLGDLYVKSEFHAHKAVENPAHIIGFLSEWQAYLQQIEGDSWRGYKIDKQKIDKMSDEQLAQLYELMQTIQKGEDGEGVEGMEGDPTTTSKS